MTKIIKDDLVLEKNMTFKESIIVEGNIIGKDGNRYNLTVMGNINAENINARDIDAWDINAWDIICQKRIKKSKDVKTICRVFVQGRFDIKKKEQMPEVMIWEYLISIKKSGPVYCNS